MRNEPVKNTERLGTESADLYWLAFLLTGRQEIGIDIASDAAVGWDDPRRSPARD